MTTDIEKQFFETFNIEKRQVDCSQPVRLDCEDCKTCKYSIYEYPEITDRILLELIRVFAGAFGSFEIYRCKNFEHLKHMILAEMIAEHTSIKHRVQSLFKEG